VKQFLPDTTVFVWDEKQDYKPNIRKSILTEYKGNRSKDSSPHQNNEIIKSILYSMGINSIFPRELEADDIVAYICNEHDGSKVIVSVDKDFLQLVNSECTLYDPIRKKFFEESNFEEQTGFKNVDEWFIAKCLTGDKSDNIAGIPKFGKVKVEKYLKGEIELTEDENQIYESNKHIFRLNLYEDYRNEKEYYRDQLAIQVNPSYKVFLEYCEEYSFKRILDNKESWHSLFFMKSLYNKLNDIAS
tara:strand:+ start:2967 stop:3701 length:735 start_codon:yes stop_codon:yes gene_type:complete